MGTYPRIVAAVVIRFARFLLWLSSYLSVSSTISSEKISSMMSAPWAKLRSCYIGECKLTLKSDNTHSTTGNARCTTDQ